MSVGERGTFNKAFEPLFFEVEYLPTPNEKNRDRLRAILESIEDDDLPAAFIYEPLLQGAGGMIMHDRSVLDEVLKSLKDRGVLLIADEVLTGFGRTGSPFASMQLSTNPDLICLSKGLTGGCMALVLTLTTETIFNAFLSEGHEKTFFHGHSHSKSNSMRHCFKKSGPVFRSSLPGKN